MLHFCTILNPNIRMDSSIKQTNKQTNNRYDTRCWTYETGILLGQQLQVALLSDWLCGSGDSMVFVTGSMCCLVFCYDRQHHKHYLVPVNTSTSQQDELPFNDYFDYYGPDYRLHIASRLVRLRYLFSRVHGAHAARQQHGKQERQRLPGADHQAVIRATRRPGGCPRRAHTEGGGTRCRSHQENRRARRPRQKRSYIESFDLILVCVTVTVRCLFSPLKTVLHFVLAPSNTKEDPRELMPESEGAKALKVCANPLIHNTIHACMHTRNTRFCLSNK